MSPYTAFRIADMLPGLKIRNIFSKLTTALVAWPVALTLAAPVPRFPPSTEAGGATVRAAGPGLLRQDENHPLLAKAGSSSSGGSSVHSLSDTIPDFDDNGVSSDEQFDLFVDMLSM
ncbi:hypothetical protein Micbo1qcDRAFT_181121 [Microdochium bolleyi]|uniref:Uncharacterized protein n=1 Tax=Microdochium bolleyi TaxID=196109 RepID=A0A136IJD2_9PEZI|nr:hypothetical protein Micbo1qcDRAFT_181121 [Microdochium bolleyi]